mgnify:FL=1
MAEHIEPQPPRQFRGQPIEPLSYTVSAAVRATGIGRSTIFAMLADGRLKRVKVGKKTLIPRASLEAIVSGKAA